MSVQFSFGRRAALCVTLSLGLVAILSALAPRAASAEDAGLKLKVSVIHATRAQTTADPNLEKIQAELTEFFAGYKGFKRLQAEERTLVGQTPVTVKLPNGETAEFRHDGVDKNRHRIRFSLPQSKVAVDLKAPLRTVFFHAGMSHDGGILILAMFLAPASDKTRGE
jgi:hypothetical protein